MKWTFSILLMNLLLLLSCAAAAQTDSTGRISGVITDESSKPVTGATLLLSRSQDSSLIKTSVTDEAGKFEIEDLPFGSYILTISYVGYRKIVSGIIVINAGNRDNILPPIRLLHNDPTMLKEVNVIARRPFIERKLDRTIINVESTIAGAGANMLEMLEISPGISVGADGSIGVKGKQGVMVFIDDKPSNLSGEDLATFLRSIPSTAVDQIEIITNPPARYDAAGSAGVINIRMKRVRAKGLNATLSSNYTQGVYARTGNSVNLAWHKNKINLFANVGYSNGKRYMPLDIYREYLDTDGKSQAFLTTEAIRKYKSENVNARIALEYSPSKKTTWGIIFNGFTGPSPKTINTTNKIMNASHNIDSIIYVNSSLDDRNRNGSVNFNFRHQFDSTGRTLTMDMDYVRNKSLSNQLYRNSTYDPNNNLKDQDEVIGDLPANINIYSARADYSQPLGKSGGRLEGGIKTSYSETENVAAYFNRVNGTVTPDYNKTNTLLYRENINAAYLNYNKEFKRFAFQTGLRMENTLAKGHQLGNVIKPDSTFRYSYTNFFPTGYISYKLDKKGNNQLLLSYGKRIKRPYYQDLNPFLIFIDKFTYTAGNPYLQPQLSHNVEFSYAYKESLKATLMYSRTIDFLNETTIRSGDVLISRPDNTGRYTNAGISIEMGKEIVKGWQSNLYAEFVNDRYKGIVNNSSLIDTSAYAFSISFDNRAWFAKGWAAELNAFYRTKRVELQDVVKPFGIVNIGVQKAFMKGTMTVKAAVRDMFFTVKYGGDTKNIPHLKTSYNLTADTRVFVLSFNWRFIKGAGQQRSRDRSGAQNEKERIKQDD